MHPFIEKFSQRSLKQQIGLWVGSFIFLIFIFWQYFYSTKNRELSELDEKITNLNSQIASEQRVANNLQKFKDEKKVLQSKLQVALRQLPDTRETESLLASVATLAKDAGLEVNKFAPQPDILKEYYAEIPVSVEMVGTYHQVASFFDDVSKLSRIVNVGNVLLKEARGVEADSDVKLTVSCNVTTFRYLDVSERPAKKTEEAPRGKPKKRMGLS